VVELTYGISGGNADGKRALSGMAAHSPGQASGTYSASPALTFTITAKRPSSRCPRSLGSFSVWFSSFHARALSRRRPLLITLARVELELEPGQAFSGEIQTENPTDTEAKVRSTSKIGCMRPAARVRKNSRRRAQPLYPQVRGSASVPRKRVIKPVRAPHHAVHRPHP